MNKLQIARIDPATDEPDWTTTQEFFLSDKGAAEVSEHWFKSEPLPEMTFKFEMAPMSKKAMKTLTDLWRKGSSIYSIAMWYKRCCRIYQSRLELRLTKDIYKALQVKAHNIFGCNLKRALRIYGCKADIYYNSNGHWFKMK